MISRKLHVVHDVAAHALRIQACALDNIQRPSKLLSSTDGIVAMEVHTQAKASILGWVAIATRVVTDYPDPPLDEPYPMKLAELARQAAVTAMGVDVALVIVEVNLGRPGRGPIFGWLFPFARNDAGIWFVDRSMHGLESDRPVAT